MRRRRMGFSLLIAAAVIVVAAGAFIAGKGLLAKNNPKSPSGTIAANSTKQQTTTTTTEKTTVDTTQDTTAKEEGFDLKLDDGTALKAVYTKTGTTLKFQYVSPKEKNVYFNINPAGDKMVIFDSGAQKILLIDDTGKVADVTNPKYVSSSGTVITKESVLNSNKSYIWCSSPAFISDTKIAYISQLPWLNKTTKYVWLVDAATGKHTIINLVHGEKITFGKLEAKGLKVDIDGSTRYITASGSVVQ
jgi:hypothetical protein